MTQWKLITHKIGKPSKPSEEITEVVDAPEQPSHETAASLLLKQVPSAPVPQGAGAVEMLYARGYSRPRIEPLPNGEG